MADATSPIVRVGAQPDTIPTPWADLTSILLDLMVITGQLESIESRRDLFAPNGEKGDLDDEMVAHRRAAVVRRAGHARPAAERLAVRFPVLGVHIEGVLRAVADIGQLIGETS